MCTGVYTHQGASQGVNNSGLYPPGVLRVYVTVVYTHQGASHGVVRERYVQQCPSCSRGWWEVMFNSVLPAPVGGERMFNTVTPAPVEGREVCTTLLFLLP